MGAPEILNDPEQDEPELDFGLGSVCVLVFRCRADYDAKQAEINVCTLDSPEGQSGLKRFVKSRTGIDFGPAY